jgi:hypothetical protein
MTVKLTAVDMLNYRHRRLETKHVVGSIDATSESSSGQQVPLLEPGNTDRTAEKNEAHHSIHTGIANPVGGAPGCPAHADGCESGASIAEVLCITESAAKSLMFRARKALRKEISGE